MEKKHIALVWLVIVTVVCALAYPSARWGLFSMAIKETTQKLPREASADQVIALRNDLQRTAERYRLDPAKLQFALTLEEHSMMGAVAFWFVEVRVSDPASGRACSTQARVERSIDEAYEQRVSEAGIPVTRLAKVDVAPGIQMPAGQ